MDTKDTQVSPTPAEEPAKQEPTSGPAFDAKDVEDNKDLAAFSYLWIMSVVVFLLKRNSPFIRFHSRQAMVLFVLSILVWIIPVIGQFLELIVLAGMVFGFLAAAQGQRKDVPIVGPLSRGEITIREAWRQVVKAIADFSHRLFGQKESPEKRSADSDQRSEQSSDSSSLTAHR